MKISSDFLIIKSHFGMAKCEKKEDFKYLDLKTNLLSQQNLTKLKNNQPVQKPPFGWLV